MIKGLISFQVIMLRNCKHSHRRNHLLQHLHKVQTGPHGGFRDMGNGQFLKLGGRSTGVRFTIILYNLHIYYILLKIHETFHNKDENPGIKRSSWTVETISCTKLNYQYHEHISGQQRTWSYSLSEVRVTWWESNNYYVCSSDDQAWAELWAFNLFSKKACNTDRLGAKGHWPNIQRLHPY